MATAKDEPRKIIGGDGLVDGETTYGEDIKGNSTHNQDTAEVKKSAAKSQKTAKEQKVAEATADKEAEATADEQAAN